MPAEATHVSDPVADPALLTHWLILGSITLPGDPQHVRSARTFVARTIGADHPRADEALLLTSELVTNAVTHSRSRLPGGTVEVVVATRASGLLISVTDDGADSTVPAIMSIAGGEHGNGLLLTETIADVWGYLQNPGARWSGSSSWRTAGCNPTPNPAYCVARRRHDARPEAPRTGRIRRIRRIKINLRPEHVAHISDFGRSRHVPAQAPGGDNPVGGSRPRGSMIVDDFRRIC